MAYQMLGILGGVGPLASVYFADVLVNHTVAGRDQDHIPFYLYNDVAIPDRSAYLLGKSADSPLPALCDGVRRLEASGCDLIVVTCNTAHYFYDRMAAAVQVPVLNIIEVAVEEALAKVPGAKKIGLLATQGTLEGKVYEKELSKRGLACGIPGEETRQGVMNLIYDVKVGKTVDPGLLIRAAEELKAQGCDAVILGCTELSVVSRANGLCRRDGTLIDAMEALARRCVRLFDREWQEQGHTVCL